MRHGRNEGAAPGRKSTSTPATTSWPVEPHIILACVGALALLIAILSGWHQWSQRQIPSRMEVQQVVAKLDPACKTILQARFRAMLVREGRPLTRGEVGDITSGIKDCAAIDQQMAGLQDG